MKIVRNILIFIVLFLGGLIIFSPKVELYYLLENFLNQNGVVISQERLKDKGYSFESKNGVISYKNIDSLTFDKIEILPFIMFNQAKITGLTTSSDLKKIFDKTLDIKVVYSIFDPLNIRLSSDSEIVADGVFNILSREFILEIESEIPPMLKQNFTKNEKGKYEFKTKL